MLKRGWFRWVQNKVASWLFSILLLFVDASILFLAELLGQKERMGGRVWTDLKNYNSISE
jgi:hypothetical protein